MPNRDIHVLAGAIAGALLTKDSEDSNDTDPTTSVLVGAAAGAVGGRLPDILEPALHPNHRQFFHSYAVLGLLGCGFYHAAKWSPETGWEKCLRYLTLGMIGGYACHLLFDGTTPKGLPLVGKL
ncbi:metal-dependent hydrolase [Kordiimonas marina]|uniref:metal-dependent hydrolase n=1 Tax=Kordiimonas marina TaxID=2872312 RepID=UPI001FF64EDA|nr:metal-dependent hydrolase [Kordiimonas marina]MCJ9429669.1 metal-dependent hydrolase [Kordiimonas marina]